MVLNILKIVGHYALWAACAYCIAAGAVGTIVIIRDVFKHGAYTPKIVLLHSTYIIIGYFLLKGLLK